MLRLRGLYGSVPERGHQVGLKRPLLKPGSLSRNGKWQDVRVLCLTRDKEEERDTWDFWANCFIVDRRKRLQTSAAMIHAGAAMVGNTSGVTTKRT